MRNENLRGIVLMLLAMAVLALMDATMKQLAAHYAAIQVAAMRGMVSLPFVIAWVWYRERGFRSLVRVRWRWHLARGVLAILMLTSFVHAIGSMPLSEAYTFFFIAPLLITVVMVAVGAGALAFPDWSPVRAADVGWLVGMGITGALGQMLITEAFRCAPISVVAPFEYSTLFWGVLLDLLVWGELPPPIVFVGAAVIVGSGLYLIHRERKPSFVAPP